MGGIFGAVSRNGRNVIGIVIQGIKALEYRGFDGSGIAIPINGGIKVFKDATRIDMVAEKYRLGEWNSWIALGHTRYATHGKPHAENTQPHTDCNGIVAVVGDGAIANYEKLKDEIIFRGHRVVSRCDFEIIAHLIEDLLQSLSNFPDVIMDVVKKVSGLHSFAILNSKCNCIAVYTSLMPMFIGISDNLFVISSNRGALYSVVNRYTVLERDEVALVTRDGIEVYSTLDSSRKQKSFRALDIDPNYIDRDGYPHHMLREIYEIPYSILRTLSSVQEKYLSFAARLVSDAKNVFIIGNGTSLHAGLIASYYLSELAGINSIVVSAAEFPLYYVENVSPGTVIIAISQSGETKDVIQSVFEAKVRGATIMGITNYIGSRLANLSNLYLPVAAGPEIAIPATKTFTSTLTLLYLISLHASRHNGRLHDSEYRERIKKLWSFGEVLLNHMQRIDMEASKATEYIMNCRSGYITSRGITYPIALEGALKFKETAYVHAEGVEAGEFRHGPQSLLESGIFTIFLIPFEKPAILPTYDLIRLAIDRGAKTVVIGFDTDQYLDSLNQTTVIRIPYFERHLTPIAMTIPLQFMAYRLGVLLGRPIDSPRYLTKTVAH
uniref:glutamine--fructose-6-phosphate transaminase (isomerizing) n=1 Tax=Ignisphaera aggregans TaxID=334771 RepID=A0A7J3JPK8_9CREN